MSNISRKIEKNKSNHYRLLNKKIISQITDKQYNEVDKPFEIKGYNLPYSDTTLNLKK